MNKRFSQEDYLVGLGLEATVSGAIHALQQADMTYQAYIAALRVRYNAPEGEWKLEDWADGFVPLAAKDLAPVADPKAGKDGTDGESND